MGIGPTPVTGPVHTVWVEAEYTDSLVTRTEARRVRESGERNVERRAELGQFFTPLPVAALLASMFDTPEGEVRVIDPGAGVGSLTAALVSRATAEEWPGALHLHAVEMDEDLLPALKETLTECEQVSGWSTDLHGADFIEWACDQLGLGLFTGEPDRFDLAILNPPYRKLNTGSRERRLLSAVGVEASNLYAAFVALSLRLLDDGGQLVAITPRSFCNGPYFKAFRKELLASAALRRVHVFESRDKAFRDTDVLQENVIVHMVKGARQDDVVISSSHGGGGDTVASRKVPFASVVHPDDTDAFIHVVPDECDGDVASRVRALTSELGRVGASVSTGRVVDFRVRDHLRMDPEARTVPLLYPVHLRSGRVRWPVLNGKKANGIVVNEETQPLLLPVGTYVLVKRFSSKEERRRIVATVLEVGDLDADHVAIENHINVFHDSNKGLPLDLAWGIATYLNSTIVDVYFRQFNGHTQVNATDLRSLPYPSIDQLTALGAAARGNEHEQSAIDAIVGRILPELADG